MLTMLLLLSMSIFSLLWSPSRGSKKTADTEGITVEKGGERLPSASPPTRLLPNLPLSYWSALAEQKQQAGENVTGSEEAENKSCGSFPALEDILFSNQFWQRVDIRTTRS